MRSTLRRPVGSHLAARRPQGGFGISEHGKRGFQAAGFPPLGPWTSKFGGVVFCCEGYQQKVGIFLSRVLRTFCFFFGGGSRNKLRHSHMNGTYIFIYNKVQSSFLEGISECEASTCFFLVFQS